MLGMHISKFLQEKTSTLWLVLSLKNYNDMFLLFTRHSMVQHMGEHVGMTHVLRFSPNRFQPSKADPDIWMKLSKDGTHYEYISVYLEDLAICMQDHQDFCYSLEEKYKLKLKGIGQISYLGCGYTRDEDGSLVADPKNMLEKPLSFVKRCLETNQRRLGHHPENDLSDFVIKTKSMKSLQL